MVKEFEKHQYWAIILGGSSGLGLASALKLAAHGMNICIVHRNTRAEMTQVEAEFSTIRSLGIKLLTYNMDVIKSENIASILEDFKEQAGTKDKVRCLLHSIAKGNLKEMVSTTAPILQSDDFVLTLQNMAISLYDWTKEIFNANLFADDARVLAFTSQGSTKAWKHYAAVSMAKAALEALVRSIALEFAPYGLRANCIQAGITNTPSLQKIPGSATLIDHAIQTNPFKRITTPEDVANAVYLLCKDEASWINGSIIPVDGGEHIS